jgi:hypothetical protein
MERINNIFKVPHNNYEISNDNLNSANNTPEFVKARKINTNEEFLDENLSNSKSLFNINLFVLVYQIEAANFCSHEI